MQHQAGTDARPSTGSDSNSDSVRAYLRRVRTVALLGAAQEVELAKRIEAALYAAQRLRHA